MTQTPPAYDIFLFYARADEAWVDGYLLDALRGSGLNVLTQEEFQPGVPVLQEYERAVTQSRYVVLVLSPAWSGERFGEFVDLLANFHGRREGIWPVVPLILQPAELPLRLAHLGAVDATTQERWPAALEKLARLLDAPLAPAQEVPDCPYPGMTPFTTEQESLFFGRDKEIADAVERLRLHPFLCVIGPSGSGKSSLVYAGVIPALRRSRQFGPGEWNVRTLRPGTKPLTALADALGVDVVETQNFASLPGNRTLLFIDQFEELYTQSDPSEFQPFLNALQTLIGQPNLHILLTVRADFYPELMGCSLWSAIQANRLDLPPLGRTELAAAIVQPAAQVGVAVDPLLVERLTTDAAGEKGSLPLVQECLRLLWQGVARRYLPAQVYAGMAEGELNGLQIAIDRHANDVYNNKLPDTARPIARRIFLRLIQFGEGRADTRRQVAETDLRSTGDDPALFADTLQTLIDRRLLTASGDEDVAARRVDIAHEALIVGWALLRGWIDERRSAEQTRRRLESTAQRWEELARAGGLLDPVELAEAQRWLAQPDSQEVGGASDSLAALIEASEIHIREEEEAKQAAQAREVAQAAEVATLTTQRGADRRRTVLLGIIALIVSIAAVTIFVLLQQSKSSEAGAVQARATAEGAAITEANARGTAEVAVIAEADARSTAEAEAAAAAASEAEAQKQKAIAEAARKAARAGELAGQALAELDLDANGSKSLALLLARESVLTTWHSKGYVTNEPMFALVNSVSEASPWLMDIRGHTGSIRSVAFSPDGQSIITASDDNTAMVWDATTGAQLLILSGHTEGVSSAMFSPDRQHIVTASRDSTAIVWSSVTGVRLLTLGHAENVNSAAFSPDGWRIVTASNDETVKIWDAITGAQLLTLIGHRGFVNSAAFSPDGLRIVTASNDETAKVWDATTGIQLLTLNGHRGSINSATFSPDGLRIVTASNDETARVWDARSGAELLIFSGHTEGVNLADFSPDGNRIVTASWDGTARVWDAQNGAELLIFSGHTEGVNSVDFSPDGSRIVTASWDGTTKVWDAHSGAERLSFSSRPYSLFSAVFSPDGSRILTSSGGNDGILPDARPNFWDAQTGIKLYSFAGHAGVVNSAIFSPDGRHILTASDDGTAKLRNAYGGTEFLILSGHTGYINSAIFSPEGSRILTASDDGTAVVWDAQSGKRLLILGEHRGPVNSATFSPDGSRILTASDDGTAVVWDAQSGVQLISLRGHSQGVNSADFSPDGSRIFTEGCKKRDSYGLCTADTVTIWNALSGTALFSFVAKEADFKPSFSPDGSRILTTNGDTVKVWDAHNGIELHSLGKYKHGAVYSAAFSPDGSRIITISLGELVKVWDARDGVELFSLGGHSEFAMEAVFSPDGSHILTAGGGNRKAIIWDAQSGVELFSLIGHTGNVWASAFSPDGQRIVTASDDGTVRTWLMPDALLALALARVQRDPREFTPEEKTRYGIGE